MDGFERDEKEPIGLVVDWRDWLGRKESGWHPCFILPWETGRLNCHLLRWRTQGEKGFGNSRQWTQWSFSTVERIHTQKIRIARMQSFPAKIIPPAVNRTRSTSGLAHCTLMAAQSFDENSSGMLGSSWMTGKTNEGFFYCLPYHQTQVEQWR